MITPETIPLRMAKTTTRPEPDGALLFQMDTDQMYFAAPAAAAVFGLCDGAHSVKDIAGLLLEHNPAWDPAQAEARVADLIRGLHHRHLVELWG